MVNSMMCLKEYEWVLLREVVASQAFKNTQRAPNTLKRVVVDEVGLLMYLQIETIYTLEKKLTPPCLVEDIGGNTFQLDGVLCLGF